MSAKDEITLGHSSRAAGKYYSIETKAQPITFRLDEEALASRPAEAIAAAVREGIASISEWTRKGRQLFNNTGRLRDGITAVLDGGRWLITAPPDRLQDPDVLARLLEAVPALTDPLSHPLVRQAVEATIRAAITVKR